MPQSHKQQTTTANTHLFSRQLIQNPEYSRRVRREVVHFLSRKWGQVWFLCHHPRKVYLHLSFVSWFGGPRVNFFNSHSFKMLGWCLCGMQKLQKMAKLQTALVMSLLRFGRFYFLYVTDGTAIQPASQPQTFNLRNTATQLTEALKSNRVNTLKFP